MTKGKYIRTAETLKKQSEAQKGIKCGEKNHMFGKHHTPEENRKNSEAHKGEKSPMFGKKGILNPNYGKHPSEETRRKRSVALSGEKNPMWGKVTSPEIRKKISIGNKGKKRSLEIKIRIGIRRKGKLHTPETKKKLSILHKGIKHTAEANLKNSISHKGIIGEKHCKGGKTPHLVTIALISSLLERLGYNVQSWYTTGERFITVNKHQYSPDIYATRDNDIMIIEVGFCPIHKLCDLMSRYPIVLHVPKMKMELSQTISKKDKIIFNLWKETANLM